MHWGMQTYLRMRGDFASQPQSTCVKAQRKELNRLQTAGLRDCGSYSWAVSRAEWISQIMLWMTCSESLLPINPLEESVLGIQKGKSCDLWSYFSFVPHTVRLHVLFFFFFWNQDGSCLVASMWMKRGAKKKTADVFLSFGWINQCRGTGSTCDGWR